MKHTFPNQKKNAFAELYISTRNCRSTTRLPKFFVCVCGRNSSKVVTPEYAHSKCLKLILKAQFTPSKRIHGSFPLAHGWAVHNLWAMHGPQKFTAACGDPLAFHCSKTKGLKQCK